MSRLLTICILIILIVSCKSTNPTVSNLDPDEAKSGAPEDYKLPKSGLLNLSDLSNFSKQKRDFVKTDDFSTGFDDSVLKDRKFAMSLPLSPYAGLSVGPSIWTYDAKKEQLTLGIQARGSLMPGARSIEIQETTDTGESKRSMNEFGAEFNVELMETWAIQLGRTDNKPIGIFSESGMFYSGILEENLTWSMKVNPQAAKALIENLELRIDGLALKNERGNTVECDDDTHPATVSSPTEWTRHICVVQTKLTRIGYHTKSGKLVKEWKSAPLKKVELD